MMNNPEKTEVSSAGLPLRAAMYSAAVFFAVNAWSLGAKSLWVDELRTAYAALCKSPHELFRYIALNDPASPLYTLISVFTCKIFGISEAALRAPALLFGTASIFAMAVAAQRLLKDKRSAALAVVLFALSPNLTAFSQEARSYTALLFAALAAFALVSRQDREINAAALAAVFIAGLYLHIVFALVIVCCVLHVFAMKFENQDRFKTLTCVVVAVVALAPYLLAVLRLNTGAPERLPGPELNFVMKFAFLISGLIAGNSYVDMSLTSMIAITGGLLWLYGVRSVWYEEKPAPGVVMMWMFAPMILLVAGFTLFSKYYNMFHFRYVIFVLPFMAVAVAAGAGRYFRECLEPVIRGRRAEARRLWLRPLGVPQAVYILLVLFFMGSVWADMREYRRTELQDWRGAMKYINEQAAGGEAVVLQGIADSSIKFYARGGGKKLDFHGTNSVGETAEIFGGARSKFVVYYRPKWGLKLFEKSRALLNRFVEEEVVFPGLYGDVVVGSSSSCTLVNELSIIAVEAEHVTKTGFERKHPVIFVRGGYFGNGVCGNVYNVDKGEFRVFPLKVYEGEESDPGRKAILSISGRGQTMTFNESVPSDVKFDRGKYSLDIERPLAGLTITRIKPLKFEDEGQGPEMRRWFLDWIRK